MKRFLLLIFFLLLNQINLFAQAKNYVKLHVGDCINCVSALTVIIKKDPKVSLVVHNEYLSDSNDVIEKFGLEPYRKQIIWSSILYDSLSKDTESELVQYCGTKEVNRSGLRSLKYMDTKNCQTNAICLPELSNHIMFKDYKDFLLISNYINFKQYIFYKKQNILRGVLIDSSLIKIIYVDFLRKPELYNYYQYESVHSPALAPKLMSLYPYDDSTVVGALITYNAEISRSHDTVLSPLLNILKINYQHKNEILFVSSRLPKEHQYLNNQVFANKEQFYIPLSLDVDKLVKKELALDNLIRLKKEKHFYKFDSYVPSTLNDYLVDNKVYQNCNSYYLDNGYYLMSISNFIVNLDTEEKIYLPFDDSVFKKIHLYPRLQGISYHVSDFKYNVKDCKFYVFYQHDKNVYIASFKPNSKTFETNEFLYSLDNSFSNAVKNHCLSWDGKKVLYCMKGENCFKYATVAEVQALAKQYEKTTETK